MAGIVYHLFCTVTGKAYVGQTWQSFDQRWREHCSKEGCWHLRNALKKYGPDAFVRSVLTQGLATQEQMDAAEKYWIKYFDCIENGYNLREGGHHAGPSEETREKLREARRKQPEPHLGYRQPESAKQAIGLANRGNKYCLGRIMSEASKIKASRSHGGLPFVDQFGTRYETISGAARNLGLRPGNICSVLKGRLRQTGGFSFKYVESV